MDNQRHTHFEFTKSSKDNFSKDVHSNTRQEEHYEFELKDFLPEIYDSEADGSCSNGHQHTTVKV